MSRNVESRFAVNPTNIDMRRSSFNRNSVLKTGFKAGDLVPIYVDEVLPGDTFNVKTSKVIRMAPIVTALMDNLYLDTYFFFVPNRLVWEHWKEFNGENTESAWIPTTEYEVPQITSPSGGWTRGSIADFMGIPVNVDNLSVSALPFRAYALICNEWFRDENLSDPLYVPKDDSTVEGSNGTDYVTDVAKGGAPFKVAKYHDYFTSCLPSPQKGPDVTIQIASGQFPVTGNGKVLGISDGSNLGGLGGVGGGGGSFGIKSVIGSDLGSAATGSNVDYGVAVGVPTAEQLGSQLENSGLIGYFSDLAVASVNQLRLAFQIQRLYEKDARGGTRYTEILKSHFGVTSPDSRLQRPEYLGGNRLPINIQQVLSTSQNASSATSNNRAYQSVGRAGAYSLTTDHHSDFVHSFTEHGFIIGVCAVRYDHTYGQGIERFWSRKDRFDYYWPVLANIGEQAVLNKEIYAQGTDVDDEVFGYQEAWADYRYKPSRVTGVMRVRGYQSSDSSIYPFSPLGNFWTLADFYSTLPTLSDSWIREDSSNVDRIMTVISGLTGFQFYADFYFQNKTTRPMPMYSIPGLIDHH